MAKIDDRAIRPTRLADFFGQKNARRNLEIFITSAKALNEPLDHLMFSGPPGTGKTTLANVVANEMGSKAVIVNAATIQTKAQLITILVRLSKFDILFIDEIHALSLSVEEVLYTAMEDFAIDVPGDGGSIRVNIEPFTLIGATTIAGGVSQPLRDRFGEIIQMSLYSVEELTEIAYKSAEKFGITPIHGGPEEIAKRSRGTPRIANRLLRRCRDFAIYSGKSVLDRDVVIETCNNLGIDEVGMDGASRKYLRCLLDKKTPVGINFISSAIGEAEETILGAIEPFLVRNGLIERTGKGRILTQKGVNLIS